MILQRLSPASRLLYAVLFAGAITLVAWSMVSQPSARPWVTELGAIIMLPGSVLAWILALAFGTGGVHGDTFGSLFIPSTFLAYLLLGLWLLFAPRRSGK